MKYYSQICVIWFNFKITPLILWVIILIVFDFLLLWVCKEIDKQNIQYYYLMNTCTEQRSHSFRSFMFQATWQMLIQYSQDILLVFSQCRSLLFSYQQQHNNNTEICVKWFRNEDHGFVNSTLESRFTKLTSSSMSSTCMVPSLSSVRNVFFFWKSQFS